MKVLPCFYSVAFLPLLALTFSWFGITLADDSVAAQRRAGQEYDGVMLPLASESSILATESGAGVVVLRIDESQRLAPADAKLFGYNFNWHRSNELFIDPVTCTVDEAYIRALNGLPLPLNRMSGTESQSFYWKKAIGAREQRLPMSVKKTLKPVPYNFGPLEWVSSCLRIDPGSRFSWVLNLMKESAKDHGDLASFFSGSENNEWGAKRIRYGMKNPVKIELWELGNELDWKENNMSLNKYVKSCKEAIEVIRKVDPSARFAALAATAPWSPVRGADRDAWREWHRRVLREFGDKIDCLVFHPYYKGLPVSQMEEYMDIISADILAITGSNRIKLYISEHGRWLNKRSGRVGPVWYETHSLEGCLSTAEFLVRIMGRSDVAWACYHSMSAGPWGVIYRDEKSGKIYTTAMRELFIHLAQAMHGDVIACKVEAPDWDLAENFAAAAILDGSVLRMIVVNGNARQEFPIKIKTMNDWRPQKMDVLSGAELVSVNGPEGRAVNVTTREFTAPERAASSMVIPAKSVTIITFEKTPCDK